MKKVSSQFVAIIALVFMVIFTVTLILAYAVPSLLNGQIGYAALLFGLFGIALFFCAKTFRKNEVLEAREKENAEKDAEGIIIDDALDVGGESKSDGDIEGNEQAALQITEGNSSSEEQALPPVEAKSEKKLPPQMKKNNKNK